MRAVTVCLTAFLAAFAATAAAQAPAPVAAPPLSCEQMEEFLRTAKVGVQRGLPVGITLPSRAMLDDGRMKHEAVIQTVDIAKASHDTGRGTEINFRDSWKFNVAGYELAKMLGLNMVTPYVERTAERQPASFSWFVADTMMERERYRKKIQPPDPMAWNRQMYAVRLFHQLIYDTDPNLTNLLITKDWRIWMIDFSRAFRTHRQLQNTKDLPQVDRRLLANLRALDAAAAREKLGRWLVKPELDSLFVRRDLLVKFFDDQIAKRGDSILYDLPQMREPCGAGLQ